MSDPDLDHRIGARIQAARKAAGLSLDALADRTGVSRGMISKIERAEASATAALLNRLCGGLGLTLGQLVMEDGPETPLARRESQTVWHDPATGYVRRSVSPALRQRAFEIVEVTFPPGRQVTFDALRAGLEQQIWVLEGRIEITAGPTRHALAAGDCLHMTLDQPVTFENPHQEPVRYAVIIADRR